MAYKAYQNFGGTRILDRPPDEQFNEVLFERSTATITHVPVYRFTYLTNTGRKIRNLKGYRVLASMSVPIIDDSESLQLLKLINMINQRNGQAYIQLPLYVYPRYDANADTNDYYQMFITSNFELVDIEQINIGQILELTFESIELVNSLSTTLDVSENNLADEDDQQLIVTDAGSDYDLSSYISDLVG